MVEQLGETTKSGLSLILNASIWTGDMLSIVNCMKCVVFILDVQSEYIIQALRASTTH